MNQFSHFLFSHTCGVIPQSNRMLTWAFHSSAEGRKIRKSLLPFTAKLLLCSRRVRPSLSLRVKIQSQRKHFHAKDCDYRPEKPRSFYQSALKNSPGNQPRSFAKRQGNGDYLLYPDLSEERGFFKERSIYFQKSQPKSCPGIFCGYRHLPLQLLKANWNIMRYVCLWRGTVSEQLY
jgi:hypothetical protein